MGHKIIIFAETQVGWTPSLLKSALKELGKRTDVDWVKVCLTSPDISISRLWLFARSLLGFLVKAFFNPLMVSNFERPRFATVTSVAKKLGSDIIEPPDFNINDPNFVCSLKTQYAPTMALSLGCLQIWRSDLLEVFELAVNFHNGYLPDYKGLMATHWSVYRGEDYSGYAFHIMDNNIDTGPIILRGRVPILTSDSRAAIERRKLKAARADIVPALEAMISRRIDSKVQPKGGTYFSFKDFSAIRIIDDPATLTAEELFRRMRCFSPLRILINDVRYPITSLKTVDAKARPLSFKTADGVTLAPHRLQNWPTWLYLAGMRLKQSRLFGCPTNNPTKP